MKIPGTFKINLFLVDAHVSSAILDDFLGEKFQSNIYVFFTKQNK